MPRSPKDNQEIRDLRREEILAAAARVFSEKGISGAKISEIASAAGLSHGLVYHYFPSKDAIFEAIVEQMLETIDNDLVRDLGIPAFERVRAGLERSQARMTAGGVEPNRVVTQALLQGLMPEHLRQRLFDHFSQLHAAVVRLLAEAQRDGDIADDIEPGELASALVCLMRGMSFRPNGLADSPFPLPRTDTILRLLRAKPTPLDARREAPDAARGPNARRQSK